MESFKTKISIKMGGNHSMHMLMIERSPLAYENDVHFDSERAVKIKYIYTKTSCLT